LPGAAGRGHGFAYLKKAETPKAPGEEGTAPGPQQGPPRAPDLGSITGTCLCVPVMGGMRTCVHVCAMHQRGCVEGGISSAHECLRPSLIRSMTVLRRTTCCQALQLPGRVARIHTPFFTALMQLTRPCNGPCASLVRTGTLAHTHRQAGTCTLRTLDVPAPHMLSGLQCPWMGACLQCQWCRPNCQPVQVLPTHLRVAVQRPSYRPSRAVRLSASARRLKDPASFRPKLSSRVHSSARAACY